MQKKLYSTLPLLLLCGSLFASLNGGDDSGGGKPEAVRSGLVFEDEFDSFDTRVWNKETHPAGWVNHELQTYDTDHVRTGKDGGRTVLIITAERKGGKIMSGRVNSRTHKAFLYGRIEACIKLPATKGGLWPAFWMMGENDRPWPACGEIDIMEMGEASGMRDGSSDRLVNTAIHYGPDVAGHEQQCHAAPWTASLQDGKYHIFSLVRTASSLAVSIDGQPFYTFDTTGISYLQGAAHIILNLAVGGDYPAIATVGGITALGEGGKAEMLVDWVRVWEK